MKSSAQLPVKYPKYLPTMTLQEYESQLGEPNGTHVNRKCGEAKGSFLACYLEDKVINVDMDAGKQKLEAESATIDVLLKEKQCKIIFDDQKQLESIFEKLRMNLPLYHALIQKNYLTTRVQCSHGNTFLHHYLSKLDLKDGDALMRAVALIEADKSLLNIRGKAGHPITLLINKISIAMKTQPYAIAYPELTNLLKVCQVDVNSDVLNHEEKASLLKICFELIGQTTDRSMVMLGFEAVIAAASLGMPLHQPMKGCADDQTALFTYVMELDTTHEWGVESLRRLLQVASREVVKLEVRVNPEAVTCERVVLKQPEDVLSYIYIDAPDQTLREDSVVIYDKDKIAYDQTLSLEAASEFYKVSSIAAAWQDSAVLGFTSRCYGLLFNAKSIELNERQYPESRPKVFDLKPIHFSEKLLPAASKYREAIIGGIAYSIRVEDGYNRDSAKRETRYWLVSYTKGQAEEFGKLPAELGYLTRQHNGSPCLIDRLKSARSNLINRKYIKNYYYAYSMIPDLIVKKNALLVYLEKGGSCHDGARLDRYITERRFNLITKKDPRLVRFMPGQIQLTAVYQSESQETTRECLLKPFDAKEPSITQRRAYDLEIIKQFRALGFDFSTPEVTAWLAGFIGREKPSPALLELLACLRACGAVFPDKIQDASYSDFISQKLVGCTEAEANGWLAHESFHEDHAALVKAHKIALGFGLDEVLTSSLYLKRFVESFSSLHEVNIDYPSLLRQWLQEIKKEVTVSGGQTYEYIYGDYSGAMACLQAYLDSGNYDDEQLKHGSNYFTLFFELIKMRLASFSNEVDAAMNHTSAKQSKILGKVSMYRRALTAGSEVDHIKAQISEIIGTSAVSQDSRVRAIGLYLQVNSAVRSMLDNKSIKSKSITNCFARYISGDMFVGKVELHALTMKEALVDISVILSAEAKLTLLSIIGTEAAMTIRASEIRSAPQMGDGEQFEYSAPKGQVAESTSQLLFTPPMDGGNQLEYKAAKGQVVASVPDIIPAIYPSVPGAPQTTKPFKERCDAYKAESDEFYKTIIEVDGLITSLNGQIEKINSDSSLSRSLRRLICRDTHQFTKYPCMIDGNSLVYYDLDNILQALDKGDLVEGVEGPLTEGRISFRNLSELDLMIGFLEEAKLRFEPVFEGGLACRM